MASTLGNRATLRAGLPVLRRDPTTLQVGIDDHPVQLTDTPLARALLRTLDPTDARRPDDEELLAEHCEQVRALVERLRRAGHLAEEDCAPEPLPPIGLWAPDPDVRAESEAALADSGLCIDDAEADAWLLVARGPVPRALLDPLVRAGTPHLLVTGLEGRLRVGPFVVPGTTACLRCVDVHEAERDPRRPFLVEQAAAIRPSLPPLDRAQLRLALAWAARDLAGYLAGAEPGTWSATVDLPAATAPTYAPRINRWLRHPDCGCAWDTLLGII